MDVGKRYVVLKAFEKALKEAIKDANHDIRAELELLNDSYGVDRLKVKVGTTETMVTLVEKKPVIEFAGSGRDFTEFMRSKGMVHEAVDESWTAEVAEVGGSVVWVSTGEIVPGAFASVRESVPYPKISGLKAGEVLHAAKREGLLEPVALPVLEGGQSGD